MTQPSGEERPGLPDQAYGVRAETYLRLLAETELRRALTYPRSPVDRIPPRVVTWGGNVAGAASASTVLARLAPQAAARAGQAIAPRAAGIARRAAQGMPLPVRQAGQALAPRARRVRAALEPQVARVGQAVAPLARQTAGVLPRARTSAVLRRTSRVRRVVAQSGWQARLVAGRLRPGGGRLAGPSAGDGLERVDAVAEVLAAAGVLREPVARSISDGFSRALIARGLLDDTFSLRHQLMSDGRGPAPAGLIQATGIGAKRRLERDGFRATMHVLALVLAPGWAVVTTVSWLTYEPPGRQDDDEDEFGWHHHLYGLVSTMDGRVADNHGGTYRLRSGSGGGGSGGPWEEQLELDPVPPPGLDWLEITLDSGLDPIRVHLPGAVAPDQPGTRAAPVSPAERAERIIDSASEQLLERPHPEDPQDEDPEDMDDEGMPNMTFLVRALRASGALAPDSPAVARLITVARRQGRPVPGELADAVPGSGEPASLPARWLERLERPPPAAASDQATDDPAATATAPGVAVMPELDGARCVIAGVLSDEEATSLTILAWGWPWRHGHFHSLWQPFTWWARDDAGRWYRGEENGSGYDGEKAEMTIALRPPVSPAVSRLEVFLTGISGEVSATIPLAWARVP